MKYLLLMEVFCCTHAGRHLSGSGPTDSWNPFKRWIKVSGERPVLCIRYINTTLTTAQQHPEMFLRVYMGANRMTFNNSIDEVYFKSPNTMMCLLNRDMPRQ